MTTKVKYGILISAALAAGATIGWIDSRPRWDDTGITVGLVFLASALFGAVEPEHPWLWALATGLGVPLWNILTQGNYASGVALLIAFAGAYGGTYAKRLLGTK
jgi:hypothetical protein